MSTKAQVPGECCLSVKHCLQRFKSENKDAVDAKLRHSLPELLQSWSRQ